MNATNEYREEATKKHIVSYILYTGKRTDYILAYARITSNVYMIMDLLLVMLLLLLLWRRTDV